jgi:hypothetical protein
MAARLRSVAICKASILSFPESRVVTIGLGNNQARATLNYEILITQSVIPPHEVRAVFA